MASLPFCCLTIIAAGLKPAGAAYFRRAGDKDQHLQRPDDMFNLGFEHCSAEEIALTFTGRYGGALIATFARQQYRQNRWSFLFRQNTWR